MSDEVRRRFRWMALGYVILAAVVVGGLLWNQDQQRDLDRTQTQLGVLGVRFAAGLCLVALAERPTARTRAELPSQRQLVEAYVFDRPVTLDAYGPLCVRAIRRAKRQIFGDQHIPELNRIAPPP